MVRENIRFSEGNFTSDGTYFYTILDGSQALQQKVDDGSVAFSYPLDTSVAGNITELHWDGVYFWSMETQAGGVGITLRKWAIESFICKQKQKINLTTGATHTYAATAFGVESYHVTVGVNDNGSGGYTKGLTDIVVSDTSMMATGDLLTFVRRNTSTPLRSETVFVEKAIVQLVLSPTLVRIAAMAGNPHGDNKGFRGPDVDISLLGGSHPPTPDSVYVTKNLWVANANSPGIPGTPALYKVRASSGSNLIQFSGTQYSSVGAMAFYTKYNQGPLPGDATTTQYNTSINTDANAGGKQTYILIARQSSLLFFNVNTNIIDRSLVMNNIKVDTVNIWPVFDMVVLGVEPNIVLYRLQQGTTYLNVSLDLTDEAWGTYNYEKQLLRRAVNSIAITASPSIIPANGTAQSAISAVLRDQYNDVVPTKTVEWREDGGGSSLSPTSESDDFGVAKNTYTSGLTEQDVKITASVTDGLVYE